MKVGKKYVHGGDDDIVCTCVALTPDGNAVVKNNKYEYVVYKKYFRNYKEIKEKKKGYVFLVSRSNENLFIVSALNKEDINKQRGYYLKHKYTTSEIKEVEFEYEDW